MSCWLSFAHVGLPQINRSGPEQALPEDLLFNPFSPMPGQALQRGSQLSPCAVTHWVTLSSFIHLTGGVPAIRILLGTRISLVRLKDINNHLKYLS